MLDFILKFTNSEKFRAVQIDLQELICTNLSQNWNFNIDCKKVPFGFPINRTHCVKSV